MTAGSILLSIAIVMAFVILNGLFAAAEFAVIKIRRSRIEEMVQNKVLGAKVIQKLHQDTENSVAGAQLGITLTSLIIGWLGEDAFTSLIEVTLNEVPGLEGLVVPSWVALVFAFVIMSGLHITIGEQVPKFLAIRYPESTLMKLGYPFRLFCVVTTPFIWFLKGVTNSIIWLLGMSKKPEEQQPPSAEEFRILFDESAEAGQLEKQETDILRRALELKAIAVKDAMLPRSVMDILHDEMNLDEVLEIVTAKKHSKFPVFAHGTETVVGILNTKDLFDVWTKTEEVSGFSVANLVRHPHHVLESVAASSLLETMKELRIQMAIVVDDSGRTVGLVTLEDLLEQLVGDIWDEYDKPNGEIYRKSEKVWHLSGTVTLFEFSSYFDIALDCKSNCSTVAGVIESMLENEPQAGDQVTVEGIVFKVLHAREGYISSIEARFETAPFSN